MANPTITFNTRLNQAGALKDAKTLRDNLGRPIDIKLNTRSLAQPLGRITGDVAEFTKSLQAATARVTAFGATSGGIIAVSQAISMVAKSVIEVDKQLIELKYKVKVLSVSFEDGSGKKFIVTTSDQPLKKRFVQL